MTRGAIAGVATALTALLGVAVPPVAAENNASPGIPAPAQGSGARASLTDIEDEVMCPICGTALNLSQAPQAERQRAFIRRQIAAGKTKDEIKDALVREYGPEVLATPRGEGFDLAAWVVPGLGIALVAIALAAGVWRWRRRAGEGAPAGASAPLDASEEARLSSDMSRYDL